MEDIIIDVDLDAKGNILPTKNDKIALIDADTIIFAACVVLEEQQELMAKEFYTTQEWNELMEDDTYFEPTHSTYSIDVDQAYEHCMDKINSILDLTGCKDFELHFTSGRKSFRYLRVAANYKANRTEDPTKKAPYGIKLMKSLFMEKYEDKVFNWYEWEADDIVVCKKEREPDKYILCAVDKDVLYSLEGTHFNYYSSSVYGIDMKFFDVTADEALKHHYKQCVMGDAADGVIGLKGVGKAGADKILKDCTTHEECWSAVCEAFEDKPFLKNKEPASLSDAYVNMRLVSMNQLVFNEVTKNWEVQLWKPHS